MTATVLQQKTRVFPQLTGWSGTFDVSGRKIDYDAFVFGDTLLLPSRLYQLNANYSGSSFEEAEQVLSYSANGNPLEVVDRSGMHTAYLWGYDDRYLMAEVKNATYSTVQAAMIALSNDVDALRTYPTLANSMVTTWTYKPLVGVTSQTDPSGMTTYYDYDGLGRLKEVYRYEGNVVSTSNKRVLNQYNYHTHAQ